MSDICLTRKVEKMLEKLKILENAGILEKYKYQ
jgi:hypothetical protein